jgi:hypothetical protein
MSLSGSVSTGYDGAHELVVGGYKQVGWLRSLLLLAPRHTHLVAGV